MRFWTILTAFMLLWAHLSAPAATPKLIVAVVDTGLDLNDARFKGVLCPSGHRDFTGTGLRDSSGHGTHVAGLIAGLAGRGDYCLLILKYFSEQNTYHQNLGFERAAFQYAREVGASVVNFSANGSGWDDLEYDVLSRARDVTFIVAAGNEGRDLDKPGKGTFPASYRLPNVTAVGSLSPSGFASKFSNYGTVIETWEYGENVVSTLPGGRRGALSGTSMATAIHTGKFIKERLRHAGHP